MYFNVYLVMLKSIGLCEPIISHYHRVRICTSIKTRYGTVTKAFKAEHTHRTYPCHNHNKPPTSQNPTKPHTFSPSPPPTPLSAAPASAMPLNLSGLPYDIHFLLLHFAASEGSIELISLSTACRALHEVYHENQLVLLQTALKALTGPSYSDALLLASRDSKPNHILKRFNTIPKEEEALLLHTTALHTYPYIQRFAALTHRLRVVETQLGAIRGYTRPFCKRTCESWLHAVYTYAAHGLDPPDSAHEDNPYLWGELTVDEDSDGNAVLDLDACAPLAATIGEFVNWPWRRGKWQDFRSFRKVKKDMWRAGQWWWVAKMMGTWEAEWFGWAYAYGGYSLTCEDYDWDNADLAEIGEALFKWKMERMVFIETRHAVS